MVQSSKNDWYPEEIINRNLCAQFDTALLEMYRINVGSNCDCFATGANVDTVSILDLDIGLSTIVQLNDTVSFGFYFFKKDKNGNITNYFPISNGRYTECLYNSISFKGKSFTPFPKSMGDVSIEITDLNIFRSEASRAFKRCIQNRGKVSKTLRHYKLE